MPWDQAEEVTFECEPGTLQQHKLATLQGAGRHPPEPRHRELQRRDSRINGRAHLSDEIYRAYGWARELGFPQINIDLIAGMVGETWDNWRDCVRKTIELAPDSVTIYQMELPFNTVYLEGIADRRADEPVDPADRRLADQAGLGRLRLRRDAARPAIDLSSAYTMVRNQAQCKFVYRDSLWHGADMFGTGVASFGHVNGVHVQNVDSLGALHRPCSNGRTAAGPGPAGDAGQLLMREMILQLKTGPAATRLLPAEVPGRHLAGVCRRFRRTSEGRHVGRSRRGSRIDSARPAAGGSFAADFFRSGIPGRKIYLTSIAVAYHRRPNLPNETSALMITPLVHPITPEELLEMPDTGSCELVDGRLVEKNVSTLSCLVEGLLYTKISVHCQANKLGPVWTGTVGRLFREFAITLSVAVAVSAFVSLTLTPMMCSRLLRSEREEKHGKFFRATEGFFKGMLNAYDRSLQWVLRRQGLTLGVAVVTAVATVLLYVFVPKGLLPEQDTGLINGITDAAQSISFKAMSARQHDIAEIVERDPDVASVASFVGAGTVNSTVNSGHLYINLKPRNQRKASAQEIIRRLSDATASVQGISLFMQAAQDVQIDSRVSRTQYQYTLEDSDSDELAAWSGKLLAKLRDSRNSPMSPATSRKAACKSVCRWIARKPRATMFCRRRLTTRFTTRSASGRSPQFSHSSTSIASFSK